MAKCFWTFHFRRHFLKLCNDVACIGGEKQKGGEKGDEELITGLSVTLGISVVFSNSPLLVCLLGPDSSN